MFWKKWVFYFCIVGCLVMWGTLSIAAESDVLSLINMLKDKNILTQQEADALVKKVNANATKERTEIKEELKTAAGKGDFLPSALRGLKFSSTIFGEWNNKKPDNGASTNEFNVNRAYFTLTKEVNDWLGMNITTDIFTSKDADDKGNGLEVRLKYAYLNLKLFGTNTELGLGHTPSDAYDSSIWPYRVQGKHLLDDLGIQSSADFGINNKGKFKYGGYMIGVYDGSGYSNSEANNNKVVSGMVYLRPLPDVPVLKGLQIAYNGSYGDSNKTFNIKKVPGADATDYPDFKANIAQVSLQHELFTIMGQYYWGDATATSEEDFGRKAYLVEAFARIPRAEKVRVFGRYLYNDPNTDKDNDTSKKIVAGLSYDLAKEFMPFVAFEKRTYDTTAAGADYDQYQAGFQLKF